MVDRFDPDWSARTLNFCCREMSFAKVALWSYEKPRVRFRGDFHHIPKFGYEEQFAWMSSEWPKHLTTDFVLSVHKDGFILNPRFWTDEFLQYDYLGAPWPAAWGHAYRVGNGGFTLRSRKFLQKMLEHSSRMTHPEDLYYAVTARPELESEGIRFAPVELAARFAVEHPIEEVPFDYNKVFGFHGWTHDYFKDLGFAIRDGKWDQRPWYRRLFGR